MKHGFKASIAVLAFATSLGLALAGSAAPTPAQAAEPQLRHQDRPGKDDLLGMITSALDLNADQQVQVKAIFEGTHAQMKTIWDASSISEDEKMARVKELHESAIAKLGAILTPDQQQKFEQFQKDHPFDHLMRGHGPGGAHDPVGDLTEALKLSPDQQVQIKSIFADFHPQIEAIEEDTSLSQEDKKAKMAGLHETMRAKVKGILTPDQLKTFDQLHHP